MNSTNFTIFPFIIWLFFTVHSFACSCNGHPIDLPIAEMGWATHPNEALNSSPSDIIFSGKLLAHSKVKFDTLIDSYVIVLTIKVTATYKGILNDTMEVKTNAYSDACGFYAPIGSDCLLYAYTPINGKGYYTNSCTKSVSKTLNPFKYEQHVLFLEVMLQKIDGKYTFFQKRGIHKMGTSTYPLLSFQIKNGLFQGEWKLSAENYVIEKGKFRQGKKVGKWILNWPDYNEYYEAQYRRDRLYFKSGKLVKKKSIIETITQNDQTQKESKLIEKSSTKYKRRFDFE